MDEDAVQLMTRSGIVITSFASIGLYTYKVSDNSEAMNSCSIIVNPGPKVVVTVVVYKR